jgi:GTP-binding protein
MKSSTTVDAASEKAPGGMRRDDLRNVAIIAHVDHGKTTLVDAMLRQSGQFDARVEMPDRVLDSNDLEREKGITILAKNASLHYDGVKINIIDTPGHADFGGEVERGLTMADGALLLVDASEGPLPQTRFVLRKALEARLPMILVVNKVDRADSRISEVVNEVYELFLELEANEQQFDFPIIYCNARAGEASEDPAKRGTDLRPLFEALLARIPAPPFERDHGLQALVTNLDASPYVGRLALCRVVQGEIRAGQSVAWCKRDGSIENAKVAGLYVTEGLESVEAESAAAGEIIAVAGFSDINIGETLADLDDPSPLPVIRVDEPSISVTIGINTSPIAGREGSQLTARLLKNRLDAEVVGNVSIRVLPMSRPDAWTVQGRGELQLAVLVETLRREGFELTVGRPEVVTKEIDGRLYEPVEMLALDVPQEYVGVVTQLMAARKAVHVRTATHSSDGRARLDYSIPSRGLIGFRTQFLTATRGTGLMHHVFDSYELWKGDVPARATGSLVSDRRGPITAHASLSLQERGTLFFGPGVEVYEGMIVGENSRSGDLDVNPTREKKLTNMRSSTQEATEKLTPPSGLSLEQMLEFIQQDECLEVTPLSVRPRKAELSAQARARLRSKD